MACRGIDRERVRLLMQCASQARDEAPALCSASAESGAPGILTVIPSALTPACWTSVGA